MVATPVVLQGVSDDDTSWTPTDNDSDIHSVSSYDPIDGEEEGGPGHDEEEGGPAHVTKASMKHTIENGPAVIEQKHTIGSDDEDSVAAVDVLVTMQGFDGKDVDLFPPRAALAASGNQGFYWRTQCILAAEHRARTKGQFLLAYEDTYEPVAGRSFNLSQTVPMQNWERMSLQQRHDFTAAANLSPTPRLHFTYPNGQNVSVEYRSAANAVQLQEWNAEDLYPWVMMIMDELIHPLDGSRVLRVRWQPTWSDCNAIVAYDKGHMRDLLLDFDSLSKKQQEERKDAIFKQLDDIESLAKNICG